MLIVDANVVAYLLIDGEKTEQARHLWAIDPDWYAPRLVLYELANVFSRLVRQRSLVLEAALEGMESARRVVRILAQEPATTRILEMAHELDLSAYDSCYVASAEGERAPLVTEDARILRAAPEIARSLRSFGP